MLGTNARVRDLCPLGTQGDIGSTTSGIAVDTRFFPWLSITPTCAWPCLVLWKWSLPDCFPEIAAAVATPFPPSLQLWCFQWHTCSLRWLLLPSSCHSFTECICRLFPLSSGLKPFPRCHIPVAMAKGVIPTSHAGVNSSVFPSQLIFFVLWPEPVMEARCRQQRPAALLPSRSFECFPMGLLIEQCPFINMLLSCYLPKAC